MDPREFVAAAAALCSGALAAFVLTNPRTDAWAVYASDRELDRWLSSQPTGVVVGAILAVLVVGSLQRAGSRRRAWFGALVAVGVLALARWAVTHVGSIDSLIALHLAKTAAAGALLGCAIAAVWTRDPRGTRGLARLAAPGRVAVTVGTAGTFLAAVAYRPSGASFPEPARLSTSALGEPPVWLLVASATATVAALVVCGGRVQHPARRTLRFCLLAVLGLTVVHRVLGSWIEGREFSSTTTLWVVVAISLAVLCAATLVAARAVGRADGRFVLVATGVAAAAFPVAHDLRGPGEGPHFALVAAVGFVAVAAGAVAALTLPRVRAQWGLALAAVVLAVAAIAPDFGSDGPLLLTRLAVVGVGAGIALAATFPGGAAVAAFGLALPFASFALAAVASVPRTRVVYESAYSPMPYAPLTDSPVPTSTLTDHLVPVAMLVVVAFCAYYSSSVHQAEFMEPVEDEQ
ncbi:hypothetical protein [Rhodococcus sp. HNM0569]|uniref:hypothetical protein n=1 Tax=Rhodococcus sp. HNM0569 TaxID=2716340 RepID=UPI00146C8E0D|nr:hypothetical protein [Rhodococcus sp. HNM0569]NLU83137.1 hypothetical protein [Rhodococcus sp. HNM0569]